MRDLQRWSGLGAGMILAALLLVGCASPAVSPHSNVPPQGAGDGNGDLKQALYAQLERWRGTRYRLGGQGRDGIDCSGLTQVVYRDVFDVNLPRTTDDQEQVGRAVKQRVLAPGDLVFFKTGLFQKHVGIYVADGKFLHASRSSGVRLSSLSSAYWSKRFLKARRVDAVVAGL
ncbi:MAG TPA: NlpC/P60 family protein [Arenicellales bacterium]|nr:NlpC/P60 family protein [Arenicellales bacterium]